MITTCLIFLATLGNAEDPTIDTISRVKQCTEILPYTILDHAPTLVEHFEPDNLYTAVRVIWCESRGFENAYNSGADDSGLFQVIPRTWEWVRKYSAYKVPEWDTFIVIVNGIPIGSVEKVFRSGDFDLPLYAQIEFKKVQFVPYWNILVSSYLVQGMHSYSPYWKDWKSSQWCWEDPNKWERKWRNEGY